MSSSFYPKLALTNIKKNAKTYGPFLLTGIGMVVMFYILCNISLNKELKNVWGAGYVATVLYFGNFVIGIFSAIFLFYTNSFLIKNRKKELGLYNILGMEKRHIGKVLMWETIMVALFTIIIGLILGNVLCKLLFLALLKLLKYSVVLKFSISFMAIIRTILLFAGIFMATLVYNRLQIKLTNPIELLHGGKHGEKEPKTRWFMALLGIAALGIAYYIALTTKSPLDAIFLFLVAVILVMLGTLFLFMAGSIVILKILKKNKKFYYQTKHFTSVSGMIYRMKQNAVGLSNICILSTAVLVTLSTTVSLYIGLEDELKFRYPYEVQITHLYQLEDNSELLDEIVESVNEKYQVEVSNLNSYYTGNVLAKQKGTLFEETSDFDFNTSTMFNIYILDDYNKLMGTRETLQDNEILIHSFQNNLKGNQITLQNQTLHIKKKIDTLNIPGNSMVHFMDSHYIVVKNMDTLKSLNDIIQRSYVFDMDGKMDQYDEYVQELKTRIDESELIGVNSEFREDNREVASAMYGSLLFIGSFLGALFLMATVLIIYYKQISEGYDDKERFAIMQKVGMSKSEVRGTIKTQILMVFFIPLVMAAIHIAFAFKILVKILNIMNLYNLSLFSICTISCVLIFALIYTLVYTLTARAYYNIVK